MLGADRTFGSTYGVNKKLDILFPRQLFKNIKFVVQIVIRNDNMIILFKLGSKSFRSIETLAG